MTVNEDTILDPTHDTDAGTNMGVAGRPSPEVKDDKIEPKVSADGNILEHGGRKYVTHEALDSERKQRQDLANTLAQLDPVLPEFEEFLKTRTARRENALDRVAGDTGGQKDEPEYLTEVAVALGYYDEQNQPDLRKAQGHLNVTRREADRSAARQIKPVAEATARDRSNANRARATSGVYSDGQPVASQKYIDAAFNALPPEYAADANIANITQVIAAGLEYLDHRKNGTLSGSRRGTRGEPMLVERGSSRYDSDGDSGMSALDEAAARSRGKSPEQWAKLSKQVNAPRAGNSNRGSAILEDV